MTVLGRLRSLAMRFVNRTSRGWSRASWRKHRDELQVGDGSASSIVQAAVGWIARNFPEAPVRVRQRTGPKGELDETTDAGAVAMMRLVRRPNAFYSGVLLWMATVADYWISGNGYWLKVRDQADGRVLALWWIPSFVIEPKWKDEAGADFISHYLYKPTAIDEYEIPPGDVVHFRFGFDPENPRKGASPLRTVLREIMTDDEAAAYTAAILRNMGVPGVIISPDEDVEIDDPDAEAIKAQFASQFGNDHRGEPMVIGAKAKVTVLSFNPQQMDLKALRRVPEERVSGVLGVPAIVAGLGAGLDRSTFANYAEAREAGYEENIIPSQRLMGADLDIQLLPDFVGDPEAFETDFDITNVRVLQEDQGKIWERVGNAVAKGIVTLADFNRAVGLPVDAKLHDVYLRDARIVAVRRDAPEAIGEAPPEPAPADGPPVPPEAADPTKLPELEPAGAGGNGNGNGNGSGSREDAVRA